MGYVLQGIRSQEELNNRKVRVIKYVPDKGRWRVQLLNKFGKLTKRVLGITADKLREVRKERCKKRNPFSGWCSTNTFRPCTGKFRQVAELKDFFDAVFQSDDLNEIFENWPKCVVSGGPMVEPCLGTDGRLYDRVSFERFERIDGQPASVRLSPLTRQPTRILRLSDNKSGSDGGSEALHS